MALLSQSRECQTSRQHFVLWVDRASLFNFILQRRQRKYPLLISWFALKAARRSASFCWIELMGGPGAVTTHQAHFSWRTVDLQALPQFLCWPQQFPGWGVTLWVLSSLQSSYTQRSPAISWFEQKREDGRERKQKHFTLCLPKDRSVILPWPQKFTEEVGESEMHRVSAVSTVQPPVSCVFLFWLQQLSFQAAFTSTKKQGQSLESFVSLWLGWLIDHPWCHRKVASFLLTTLTYFQWSWHIESIFHSIPGFLRTFL